MQRKNASEWRAYSKPPLSYYEPTLVVSQSIKYYIIIRRKRWSKEQPKIKNWHIR